MKKWLKLTAAGLVVLFIVAGTVGSSKPKRSSKPAGTAANLPTATTAAEPAKRPKPTRRHQPAAGSTVTHAAATATASKSRPATTTVAAVPLSVVRSLWIEAADNQYPGGGGTIQTGDSRGCAKVSKYVYDCVGYVRDSTGSLDTGVDVAGSVNVLTRTASAHRATTSEIQGWMSAHQQCAPCD